MQTMTDKLTTERFPWRFEWHGGRLMEVYHAEVDHSVEGVQVGAYDFREGRLLVPFTQEVLEECVNEWMASGWRKDIQRELPWL